MTAAWGRLAWLGAAALGLSAVCAASVASCAQTPAPIPVRSFEGAERIDVVCLHVRDKGVEIPTPEALRPSECAPPQPGADGTLLANHLYGLVTQTVRGELAVVDLTGGYIIDIDRTTPGINFLPIGANPTDVAVARDGRLAFVGSAAVNKPALYAIDTRKILGDSRNPPDVGRAPVPALTDWSACGLPDAPLSISLTPLPNAGDAGDDATPKYAVVVVFAGGNGKPSRVVAYDANPFASGQQVTQAAGGYAPGSLSPCVPLGAALDLSVPASDPRVSTWGDGVPYVDGGIDLTPTLPVSPSCAAADGGDAASDAAADQDGSDDAASPVDAGAAVDASSNDGGLAVAQGPHASTVALDLGGAHPTLYVGDDGVPLIHVIDLTDPASPRELTPLTASSVSDPTRKVAIGPIAVSPATRDYKRFLYAVDRNDGSIMVYDVTDPVASPKTPLQRPHPELNPFQPVDRIALVAPVAALSFFRHDWPLTGTTTDTLPAARTGLLCNPNSNVNTLSAVGPDGGGPAQEQGPFVDGGEGAYYRANVTSVGIGLGPFRLRGIFAFATLSNGQVFTIDVDDWDAPCRRPDPLSATPVLTSAASPPESQPTGPDDIDPYHAPNAWVSGYTSSPVSLEAFFPVSAPHQLRSAYVLRNDVQTGLHAPSLSLRPTLFLQGTQLVTTPSQGEANPIVLPTQTAYADPAFLDNPTAGDPSTRTLGGEPYKQTTTLPDGGVALGNDVNNAGIVAPGVAQAGVRFSYEDPHAHFDQDWFVTYEGVVPGYDTYAPTMDTPDGYQTMTLSSPGALFCEKGVEDFDLGAARARARASDLAAAKLPVPERMDRWTSDYVQIIDDVLDVNDPYWKTAKDDPVCGGGDYAAIHDACVGAFGATLDVTNPQPSRDFPILRAYDNQFVIGRYGYRNDPAVAGLPATSRREVVAQDPSNVPFLKQARCCFHNQARVRVRAGGQWVAIGTAVGFSHHVVADPSSGRCVQSCDPRDALRNGRAGVVPRPNADVVTFLDRNSAVALRNPMLSFVVWDGVDHPAGRGAVDVRPTRDMQWKFSTRGQFTPLNVNAFNGSTAVNPQSMRFIEALGAVAVIDGAANGLVLIDLNTLQQQHAPYY